MTEHVGFCVGAGIGTAIGGWIALAFLLCSYGDNTKWHERWLCLNCQHHRPAGSRFDGGFVCEKCGCVNRPSYSAKIMRMRRFKWESRERATCFKD